MYFADEFEYLASDGKTYYIEVAGNRYSDDYDYTNTYIELDDIRLSDEAGNPVNEGDSIYTELVDAAYDHDYEVEEHFTDTSHYGDHEDLTG